MPFTPSHAVVALPFIRTPLVPAAIAVGAMTPDLPLFVRGLPLHYGITHDLAWLPVTVIVALVLLLVWRCVLRPAVGELSPTWLAARLPEEWRAGARDAVRETFAGGARGMLLLVASLVIGVVSHVVWDLFTHDARWGVEVLPALGLMWGPLLGFKWLQYGSGVLGLAIMGVWAILRLGRADASPRVARVLPEWARWAWWVSLPVALVAAWIGGLAVFGPLDAEFTVAHLAYRVLPPACAVWGVATIALCIVVQAARGRPAAPVAV